MNRTCQSCYFRGRDGRCIKHSHLLIWAFSPACDDYTEVKVAYASTTTTAPKAVSYTTKTGGSKGLEARIEQGI